MAGPTRRRCWKTPAAAKHIERTPKIHVIVAQVMLVIFEPRRSVILPELATNAKYNADLTGWGVPDAVQGLLVYIR